MCKSGLVFCLIGALVCVAVANAGAGKGAAASSYLNDIQALLDNESAPVKEFDDLTLGFDSKDDRFFYQDNLVGEQYKRNKLQRGLITLGGQADSGEGARAHKSSYPFVVAQRTMNMLGTFADRWDIKDTGNGKVEFFALYHGTGNSFVVNKLRAHLLRKFANRLQAFTPILDRAFQEDAQQEKKEEQTNAILEEVRAEINNIFFEVDQQIRRNMEDKDDSTGEAVILMVTESALVTASVGGGQAIGFSDTGYSSLIEEQPENDLDDRVTRNVFGARGSRGGVSIRPHVRFISRKKLNVYSVLLESPNVAACMANIDSYLPYRVFNEEFNKHKHNAANEQYMYKSVVNRIIEATTSTSNSVTRFFLNKDPDHSVILVGLTRDYSEIH